MNIIPYSDLTTELARKGCLVTGMPNEEYHAYDGISKSGLDLIDRSPAHYFFAARREPSRAMEIGTAIHTALLEPDRFSEEYVLLRNVKDRRASEYKAAVKVHGSERVLVSHEADSVAGMQESVMSQPDAKHALSHGFGYKEVSAFIEDPETGVLLRCRYDSLRMDDHKSTDLKKTRNASPEDFAKSILNYRYHVQDAMYSHIYELLTGEPLDFRFLAVEDQPPHCAMVYTLDEESKAIGFEQYRENLRTYADCLNAGEWPGYADPVQTIGLPAWAIANQENEIVEEIY